MKEKRSVLICCDLLCISISVTSSKLVDLGLIVILKPIVFFFGVRRAKESIGEYICSVLDREERELKVSWWKPIFS